LEVERGILLDKLRKFVTIAKSPEAVIFGDYSHSFYEIVHRKIPPMEQY
jgi:hypothetical protein